MGAECTWDQLCARMIREVLCVRVCACVYSLSSSGCIRVALCGRAWSVRACGACVRKCACACVRVRVHVSACVCRRLDASALGPWIFYVCACVLVCACAGVSHECVFGRGCVCYFYSLRSSGCSTLLASALAPGSAYRCRSSSRNRVTL